MARLALRMIAWCLAVPVGLTALCLSTAGETDPIAKSVEISVCSNGVHFELVTSQAVPFHHLRS